jgi:hypothetical protein
VDGAANPVIDFEGAPGSVTTGLPGLASPGTLTGPGQGVDGPLTTSTGTVGEGTTGTGKSGPAAVPRRGAPDRFARWVLRIHEPPNGQEVHNLFSASMALSGTRCLLSYIVLPVLAPWLGAVPFIGPAIGIPVGLLALVFDVRAIRRFFQSDHRWRWVAAALYLTVMALVMSLIFRDISRLV